VTVDDAPAVGEFHAPAGFLGYLDGLIQEKAVVVSLIY
jgi:hypothetical protein